MFVTVERLFSFLAFDVDGGNFIAEMAGFDGACGTGLRAESEAILFVASDLVLVGEHLGCFAHQHLGHRTEESIAMHAVDEFLIAQAKSPAGLEIVWQTRHGFSPARQNAIEIAHGDFLESESDRLESGCAGFVDGVRRNFPGHAAADGNLPSGIWSSAGLPGIAEDGFFHLIGANAGAFHRCFCGHHTHISSGHRGQGAAKLANWRAYSRKNVNVAHETSKTLV